MNNLMSKSALIAAIVVGTLGSTISLAADGAKQTKDEVSRAQIQQQLEAAQSRLDAAAREVANLSMSLSEDVAPHIARLHTFRPSRAVLGMVIGSAGAARRDDGVEIMSVSPGGGAAQAGLKAGDVLTEINGTSLKESGEQSPERRFLSSMRSVEPGEKVSLKYLRDGKPASATVQAREAPPRMFNFAMGAPPPPGFPPLAFTRARGVVGSAQFVALTPKLGQYFGSEKGLLVVRAPSDARLKLEEGDVIVDIDGRVPSSPSHALQILTSYQAGEKMKLNILRMKKRMSFDITVPQDQDERGHTFHHESGDVLIPAPHSGAIPVPPHDEVRRMTSDEPEIL
jgi:S1-C subfamily serine protease